MGLGELILLLLIAVVVVGSTGLPRLGEYLENLRNQRQIEDRSILRERHAWSGRDWLLVAAVAGLGVAAIGLALARLS
jgi:hypothetical protein